MPRRTTPRRTATLRKPPSRAPPDVATPIRPHCATHHDACLERLREPPRVQSAAPDSAAPPPPRASPPWNPLASCNTPCLSLATPPYIRRLSPRRPPGHAFVAERPKPRPMPRASRSCRTSRLMEACVVPTPCARAFCSPNTSRSRTWRPRSRTRWCSFRRALLNGGHTVVRRNREHRVVRAIVEDCGGRAHDALLLLDTSDTVWCTTLNARRARPVMLDSRHFTHNTRRSMGIPRCMMLDAQHAMLDARLTTLNARCATLDMRRAAVDT